VPHRLADRSPALAPRVELEGVDRPTILTKVRVRSAKAAPRGSPAASCVERDWGTEPEGSAVELIGVTGSSVSFANASKDQLLGCDGSESRPADPGSWCGAAAGELRDGRLLDPRLDLVCATANGTAMGFAWVEPSRAARFVAVDQGAYVEVHEVKAGLPVRVATTRDVDADRARALFRIAEYDSAGRLLRGYRLEASVAG
jgi:hypothetical protein